MNTPKSEPKSLNEAQWRFVLKIRGKINNDAKGFFLSNDWKCITPSSGGRFDSNILSKQTTVESFYVKPVAAWVPHLLVPNHIPCCPHCKSRKHVDIVKSRWINCPKVLYGTARYRYMDTILYLCTLCGRRFAGYNKQSMQLDASLYYGFFTFYLGHGFAVDDDLFRLVIESANTSSTSSIEKKLRRMSYDAYYEDHQLYLTAVGLHKIRPSKKQKTLREMMPPQSSNAELQALLNQRSRYSNQLSKAKVSYLAALERSKGDWNFKAMLGDKDNHNVHGARNYLQGLGSTKIRTLLDAGIESCKQLLKANPRLYPTIKPLAKWKKIVEQYYAHLQAVADEKKADMVTAQGRYEVAMDNLVAYEDENGSIVEEAATMHHAIDGNEETTMPSTFSAFVDNSGYNGRVLSKYRIDSIVMSVFKHRQNFQQLKMQGLTARLLKIDFNYKLAEKIHVWTKAGSSFSPYKCIVTIQNEDSLTVFWKALKHSESFTEIKEDLHRLRRRLNRNFCAAHASRIAQHMNNNEGDTNLVTATSDDNEDFDEGAESVVVIYVDNCCNVSNIVREIFPGVAIKLDPFHWLKR